MSPAGTQTSDAQTLGTLTVTTPPPGRIRPPGETEPVAVTPPTHASGPAIPLAAAEGMPAVPFHAAADWLATAAQVQDARADEAERQAAVTRLFAAAEGNRGVLDVVPFPADDEVAWHALTAGWATPGAALVPTGGPAGSGTQSRAMAEENRAPWGLMFAPALFTFATPRRSQATILLIEHDEPTLVGFQMMLAHQGYLVLPAGTAHDAWGVLRAPLAPIDLVLLDAHLPDVSGMNLYTRLREVHPRLPVVICTDGDLDPNELAAFRALGAVHYLRKPIAGDKLLATVQAMLR